MRILMIALIVVVAAFLTASPAGTQSPSAQFQLTELEMPSSYTSAVATAINDVGQIVGNAGTAPFTAVLWENGTVTDLPGDNCLPTGINNRGQIVGYRLGTIDRAVLWENGTVIELPALVEGGASRAIAINGRGQIVGYASTTTSSLPMHAVVWEHGQVTDLGTLPDDWLSFAQGINDRGQIVGGSLSSTFVARVFVWQRDAFTVLPSGGWAQPWDINDLGQIVGDGGGMPVLWENGTVTELPAGYGSAKSINNRGQIVGSSNSMPVLWENGVSTQLPTSGASGGGASGINIRGQIVGSIQVDASFPPHYHPVLWKR